MKIEKQISCFFLLFMFITGFQKKSQQQKTPEKQ
jgi:hypothetical protein